MARSVTLLLAGTSPNGQKVLEQKWAEFLLVPGEAKNVRLPMDLVPIQSTERPSGLSVIAQFAEPGAAAETERRIVFSEPLLLTFNDDFETATVRTLGEQKKFDADARVDALLQHAFEVRVRNEKSGAIVAMSAQGDAANDWSGAMVVRKVSPEEIEASLDDPHTPETNTPPHDGGPGFEGETL